MTNRIYISETNIPQVALARDLMFDTNVWLRIHGIAVDSADARTRTYSAFFKKALEANRRIFVMGTVLSEYIHRSLHLRAEHVGWKGQPKIHQRPEYSGWLSGIADEVSFIMEDSIKLDDGFSISDPEAICRGCSSKTINYNDVIIVEMCKQKNLTLVTDDADFSNEPIEIVTRNRKLK